ncbi:MAG TPA: twin-arginine translocase subunit TatC [Gammaproteobacteria bacterium]|nr:twin-arginine translocase subunit TatC [Gammaproteobacteria bacterium]
MSDFSIDPNTRIVTRRLLDGALEARARAMKMVLGLLAIFAALTPFADKVFHWIAEPLMRRMSADSQMIAKDIASPFLTPLRATFWASVFLAMPLILYQIWRLIDGWLPARAKRIALPFILASAMLFYVGVAFAFFLVLPMAFSFFTRVAPKGVTVMTDIKSYLDFVIGMLFAFGLAFQVPIAIVIVVWTGLVSRKSLAKSRPYVFLGAFVVGMILTPPDVFSQTLLALPMYGLYEAALLFCWRFVPDRA